MFTTAHRIQLENTRIARTPEYSVEGKNVFCFRRTAIFLVWSKDRGQRLTERKNNDNFPVSFVGFVVVPRNRLNRSGHITYTNLFGRWPKSSHLWESYHGIRLM